MCLAVSFSDTMKMMYAAVLTPDPPALAVFCLDGLSGQNRRVEIEQQAVRNCDFHAATHLHHLQSLYPFRLISSPETATLFDHILQRRDKQRRTKTAPALRS